MKGREKWEGVIQMGGSVPITGYASCNSLKPGTPKPQVDKNEKFNLWITQKIKQKRKKMLFFKSSMQVLHNLCLHKLLKMLAFVKSTFSKRENVKFKDTFIRSSRIT